MFNFMIESLFDFQSGRKVRAEAIFRFEETFMTRRSTSADQPKKMLDRSWHLARTPQEMDVAEIEYALIRCFEAFGHWQAECLASVADFAASGPENALLHMIRMNDRPKSVRDLAHMANRQDVPNIQYSLRKLIKGGLVVRSGSGRSGVTYETHRTRPRRVRPLCRRARRPFDRAGGARARARRAPAGGSAHAGHHDRHIRTGGAQCRDTPPSAEVKPGEGAKAVARGIAGDDFYFLSAERRGSSEVARPKKGNGPRHHHGGGYTC